MRRFVLVLLVALLTASLSGASSFLVPEPCVSIETTGAPDASCPPTCVRCGCCAQPVVPSPTLVALSTIVLTSQPVAPAPRFVTADPREVLHVPRLATL